MWETLLDALLDTLKVFPFLLLIYILIELLEHKTSLTRNRKILQGGFAPLIGSAAGIIPLCGFSVMAAKLYDNGYIRTGTVMAVFIATSDEAIIVLASNVTNVTALGAIAPLLIVKFLLAVIVGYSVNALLSREKLTATPLDGAPEHTCEHSENSLFEYLGSALVHSLKVALYLLIVNVAFGLIVYYVGEDTIASSFVGGEALQPLITAAVGLIPSCASSVIITGTYIHGGIMFGSMAAGLIVNAGMGLMILLRNPRNMKRTLAITLTLYVVAYLSGVALNYIAPLVNL